MGFVTIGLFVGNLNKDLCPGVKKSNRLFQRSVGVHHMLKGMEDNRRVEPVIQLYLFDISHQESHPTG